MTTTSAREAIATLIDLAQQGEIDPWDVRVIDVIDRFLAELGFSPDTDTIDRQTSLSRSGQAFLWASMLVALKADTLERLAEPEEDIEILEEIQEAENYQRALPLNLENHIRRRSSAPPPRKRRVTLEELIEQLQQIAVEIETTTARPTVKRPRPQSRQEAVRTITQLAHQENLTEVATQLEQFLTLKLPQVLPGKTWIDLDELVHWWSQGTSQKEQPESDRDRTQDKVGVFWALLLLSSQSKVELSQNEFYQDLKVQVIV